MIEQSTKEIRFAKKISLGLFSIGTILLLIFCYNRSPFAALIGYVYTAMAFVVALIYLLVLVYDIFRSKVSVTTGLQCALVVLLNIPIVSLYTYIAIRLTEHWK